MRRSVVLSKGPKRGVGDGWTDGRCGWQPLQLFSHVNNKQEKRRALASFDCSPVSSSIPATEVQGYLNPNPGPYPLPSARASLTFSFQTQKLINYHGTVLEP